MPATDRKLTTWEWYEPSLSRQRHSFVVRYRQPAPHVNGSPDSAPTFYIRHSHPDVRVESGDLRELRGLLNEALRKIARVKFEGRIAIAIVHRIRDSPSVTDPGTDDSDASYLAEVRPYGAALLRVAVGFYDATELTDTLYVDPTREHLAPGPAYRATSPDKQRHGPLRNGAIADAMKSALYLHDAEHASIRVVADTPNNRRAVRFLSHAVLGITRNLEGLLAPPLAQKSLTQAARHGFSVRVQLGNTPEAKPRKPKTKRSA